MVDAIGNEGVEAYTLNHKHVFKDDRIMIGSHANGAVSRYFGVNSISVSDERTPACLRAMGAAPLLEHPAAGFINRGATAPMPAEEAAARTCAHELLRFTRRYTSALEAVEELAVARP